MVQLRNLLVNIDHNSRANEISSCNSKMALPMRNNRNYALILLVVLLLHACGTVSDLSNAPDSQVCASAVTSEESLYNWEKRESKLPYVDEAKSRGFELGDCIRIRGRIDSWPIDTRKIKSDSNKSICTYAVSRTSDYMAYWRSWGNFLPFVSEAKRRGLSAEDCLEIRGSAKAPILEPNSDISDLPDGVICSLGTSRVGNELRWDNYGRLNVYSDEAKRRGLSLEECKRLRVQ